MWHEEICGESYCGNCGFVYDFAWWELFLEQVVQEFSFGKENNINISNILIIYFIYSLHEFAIYLLCVYDSC